MSETIADPSVRLKTAVSPRRLAILELVWDRERTVSEIAGHLPVSVPAVSQHLAKLRSAGLVTVRAEGRRRYYRAAHETMGDVSDLLRPILGDAPPGSDDRTSSEPSTAPERPDSTEPPSEPRSTRSMVPAGIEVDDELASWYRQGLPARIMALQGARRALDEGDVEATDSIRRIATTLVRPTIAERLTDVAAIAQSVVGAPPEELDERVDRLIGAMRREMAPDDDRIAHILIVEDSRVEAALHRSIVSGPNREVVIAPSAEEAQAVFDRQEIDLIILDLGLPGEDGRELLARLGRRPRTAAIPVILLTGREDVHTRTEALSLGADAFYTKPANKALLTASVAMMLERSAEARQAGRQDALTGLKNRTVFSSEIRQTVASAIRAGAEAAFAILDLDRLGAINDFHGSEAGDLVVRHFAHLLRDTFRESDNVARWGGAKFAVLFSHAGEKGGALALRKLEAVTRARSIALPDGSEMTVAWHAGVATVGGAAKVGLDDAIARATRRLQVAARRPDDPIVASDVLGADRTHTVLLLEDDRILADLIEHRLGREGFDVVRFSDGADALAAMADVTASAVVLDAMLPGADGFEVLRTLRESASYAGIPVVVLTFGSDHDTRRAFELGASDALAKPFSVKELVARVSRLIRDLDTGSTSG